MTKINRRRFLQTATAGTAMLGLKSMRAFGSDDFFSAPITGETRDHIFVQIQIEGGAEMLLSLDPMFVPKGATESVFSRGYGDADMVDAGPFLLGPSAAALKKHAADIAIVRGIWVDPTDKSHEACRTYMASGQDRGYQQARIASAEVGRLTEQGLCGVLLNTTREFITTDQKIRTTMLSKIQDMAVLPTDRRSLMSGVGLMQAFEQLMGSREAYSQSGQLIAKILERIATAKKEAPVTDEMILAIALSEGASSTAFFNLGGDYVGPGPGLDTHSGHDEHPGRQKWFWDRITMIFDLFKTTEYKKTGKSLFDCTTFLVNNEFSRPPMRNGAAGKDHNCLTNSALLAGKGVKGGTAVGGSFLKVPKNSKTFANLMGLPYDFAMKRTLEASEVRELDPAKTENIRFLRPEDVITSLVEILDIDRSRYAPLKNSSGRVIEGLIKA